MKVDVAIPRTKFDFFTYNSKDNLQVGDLVLVPLRNQSKYGIVIKTNSQRDVRGIKDIKEVVERKFVTKKLIELYKWIADYYISTQGEVLRLAIPSKILKKYEPRTRYVKIPSVAETPTPTYPQSTAIKRIFSAIRKNCFATFLLYGISSHTRSR